MIKKREDFDFDNNARASLGLNKRVQKKFDDKDYNDVIEELDTIADKEVFDLVRSYCEKKGYHVAWPKHLKGFNYNYIDVVGCQAGQAGHEYRAYVTIEIGYEGSTGLKFFTWSPFFMYDNHFLKVWQDYVLEGAEICKTYNWYILYQNWSSLPYKLSRSNMRFLIKGIDRFMEMCSDLVSKIGQDSTASREEVAEEAERAFKPMATEDLWKYVKDNGGLVATDESVVSNRLPSQEIILENIKKSPKTGILERIENGIYESSWDATHIKQDKDNPDTFWMVSEGGIAKRCIDMSLVEGWKPCGSAKDALEDLTRQDLLIEKLSGEASKFLRVPSSNGIKNRHARILDPACL